MTAKKIWDSEVAENTNIAYNNVPFKFHTVDRSILRVANKAIDKNKEIVINYPLHKCDLLAPLAIEACYTLINKDARKVLLITNKLSVREFYESLVQAGGKVSSVLFPIGMVSRNGTIKPIYDSLRGLRKKYKDYIRDSVVLLSSSLKYLPEETSSIGTVIFDLTNKYETDAINYIKDWCAEKNIRSVVFIVSESNSELITHFESLNIPIWGWTPSMLKKEFGKDDITEFERKDTPFYKSAVEVQRIITGLEREAEIVETPELLERMFSEAYEFFRACKKIFYTTKNKLFKEAIYTYLKVIGILERIPAPLDLVENEESISWGVLSIEKRFEKLRLIQKKISEDDAISANLLENAFSNLLRLKDWYFDNHNPKYARLLKIIQENSNKKKVILVFRSCDKKALLEGLERDIDLTEEQLEQNNTRIISYLDLDSIDELVDELYVIGKVPKYAQFVVRASFAEKIKFLVYPFEINQLTRQLENDDLLWNQEFSVSERINAISSLLDKGEQEIQDRIINEYSQVEPPKNKNIVGLTKTLETDEESSIIEELESDIVDIDYDFDIDYQSDSSMITTEGITVPAVRIDFDDGDSILIPELKRVSYFIQFKDKIVNKEANRTRVGDILVIVNKGTKDNLTKSMFDVLHRLPSMKKTIFLVQSWVSILNKEMKKNNYTSEDIINKLDELDSQIREPLTITHWQLGETMGPRDKKDILRLGKIFSNEFLIDNFPEISAAITTLRGIHHKLVRRLNLLIPKAGIRAMKGGDLDEDMISEEFGLHVEDFYDSISLKRVQSIENRVVDYSICNKLFTTKELLELEGKNE